MKTTVEKKPHAQAVVTGTLSVADIDAQFALALDRFIKEVALPGFRKGKAPKERVIEEVGHLAIWKEAAETALREKLGDMLAEHTLVPIVPPDVTLTVTEAQQDVPFSVTVTTRPTVELKNPKKIAESALTKLEPLDRTKELGEAKKSLKAQTRAMLQVAEERALSDDEAKKLGFENAVALDHFLDGEAEKAVDNFDDQRKRGAVATALIDSAVADIPEVLIAEEATAMLESAKKNIAGQGMPFNEYLDKRGKTEAEVLDEMRPQAEKRVILDFIFATIAKEHALTPDDAETHKVAHALMHQGVPDHAAHQYGAEVSVREQVWVALGVTASKPKEEKVEPEPVTLDKETGRAV